MSATGAERKPVSRYTYSPFTVAIGAPHDVLPRYTCSPLIFMIGFRLTTREACASLSIALKSPLMRRLKPFIALVVATGYCLAQSITGGGTIQGTVKDPTGAAIPKAKVAATHLTTGEVINSETNSDGFFATPPIKIGRYKVRVQAAGMMVYSTNYVQDGAASNNREFGGSMNIAGLESVGEVRVETSTSNAKYSSPASIIVTTKGGGNQVHLAVYETVRNNAFGVARAR